MGDGLTLGPATTGSAGAQGMAISMIELPQTMGRALQVASALGVRIVGGEIPTGETLPPEADLLKGLGVSRTTLREAIKILSAKGLVRPRPKLGTAVRPVADWNLLDADVLAWLLQSGPLDATLGELFAIRRMIETEAAAMAAAADAPARDAIAAAYAALAAAAGGSEAAALAADVAFHRAIIEASGNRFMVTLASASEAAMRATVHLSVQRPGGLPFSLAQHEEVLRRIEARDPAGARSAMQRLIDDAQADALNVARLIERT